MSALRPFRQVLLACVAGSCLCLGFAAACSAEATTVNISIREHLFEPSRITLPAGEKFKLVIENLDDTPEEFESFELNREKVIPASQRGIIFIGPLEPGNYSFFGEFNPKHAQGVIIVE